MSLEHILAQPEGTLEICLRERPYGAAGRAELVRDVMGLANLPGEAARFIVLGVSRDADGHLTACDLPEQALARGCRLR